MTIYRNIRYHLPPPPPPRNPLKNLAFSRSLGAVLAALVLLAASCGNGTTDPPADTYTVSGTISTSDGASAAGASVQLTADGAASGSPASAGANGAYTISNVAEGLYGIRVTLEGYDTGTIAAFAVAGNVTGKDLTLVKTGTVTYTVSGVISTSDGAGAADASVSIKKDGTPLGSAVTAGADGAYTISGVPAGTYTIEASLEGYANGTLSVTVSAENVTGQNLTLEKAEAADTTPPAKVSGLTGSPGNGQVSLSWTDPADTDLASIEITWSSGNGSATVDKGAETYTATGLTNGTEYTFTVKAVDASGNKSEGETTTHTPADTAPPAAVAGLTAVPGKWIVRLTWTDPADADLASIVITWTAGSGGTETVTKSTRADRANSKIITGLTNGTAYTFTVKAKDAAGNLNAGQTAAATPDASGNIDIEPPAEVTGLTGTPGNTSVTLTWTDPTDADLKEIEITWTLGNGSDTVAKGVQTYTATGLTNKTEYTFTVRAVDDASPNPNKSFGKTASVTLLPPTALVTVEFDGLPQDETIDLTGTRNLSWSANTQLAVSVSGSFTAYEWYLDGEELMGETTNSLTLDAEDLSIKKHTLTVFVTQGGVEYTKSVTFTVTL